MSVFVDTSALLALLDADDPHHANAVAAWERLADEGSALVTTNYVVVETIAVVRHRLGLAAVRTLLHEVMPLIDTGFIDAATHGAATTALVASGRRPTRRTARGPAAYRRTEVRRYEEHPR
jgi:predicted nucleic acid-binding protein